MNVIERCLNVVVSLLRVTFKQKHSYFAFIGAVSEGHLTETLDLFLLYLEFKDCLLGREVKLDDLEASS